jgi:hypothetical protein
VLPKIDQKVHWFIPIINDDGRLQNVIHEDAVWRFVASESEKQPPTAYTDILKKSMGDVIQFIKGHCKYESLNAIYFGSS